MGKDVVAQLPGVLGVYPLVLEIIKKNLLPYGKGILLMLGGNGCVSPFSEKVGSICQKILFAWLNVLKPEMLELL